MNWTNIWLHLFGTTTLMGLDMGFWAAMAVVALIVVVMNVAFWSMKPRRIDCPADPGGPLVGTPAVR